ncbi:coiled-coil domain-containing protein [Kalamiella sp. sgz302252]|uniref:coiled-coil domain-containing protein n=1 Tax=Pantoea sp. sgz302252 TaxID=3341827 RepID=UPI0036D3CF83
MSFKISDHISIKFHQLTGGNISSKRATRLAESLKNVNNVPDKFTKALEKKSDKHPELRLNIDLALNHVNKASQCLDKGLVQQETMLAQNKKIIEDFNSNLSKLVMGFHKANQHYWMKLITGFELKEQYGIDFCTNDGLMSEKRGQLSLLKDCTKEIDKIEKERQRHVGNPENEMVIDVINTHYEKQKEPFLRKIRKAERKIAKLDAEIKTNKESIIKAIISTALLYKNNKHIKETGFFEDCRKLVSDFKSAPNIISKIESNIKLLESEKEKVEDYAAKLDHLKDMLSVANIIKEANETLAKQQEENNKTEAEVNATMQEQLAIKSETDNALLNNLKQTSKPARKKTVTFSFPEVPQHKPVISAQNKPKKALITGK